MHKIYKKNYAIHVYLNCLSKQDLQCDCLLHIIAKITSTFEFDYQNKKHALGILQISIIQRKMNIEHAPIVLWVPNMNCKSTKLNKIKTTNKIRNTWSWSHYLGASLDLIFWTSLVPIWNAWVKILSGTGGVEANKVRGIFTVPCNWLLNPAITAAGT